MWHKEPSWTPAFTAQALNSMWLDLNLPFCCTMAWRLPVFKLSNVARILRTSLTARSLTPQQRREVGDQVQNYLQAGIEAIHPSFRGPVHSPDCPIYEPQEA